MLWALTLFGTFYWGMQALALRLALRGVPRIRSLQAPAPARWPRVSLVMPTRNEASHLAAALRSKLDNGYPDLELVFVDDRSTDETVRVADEFAATDPRVRVVRVTALPDGWLGKLHAMQRGVEQASGEWLLFSDADVHLAPGALERIVAYADANGFEHVAVFPGVDARGPLLLPALATFFRVLFTGMRPWRAQDPRSSAAVGVGAFNLVRRSALARTPGLAWIKMEISDDVALGFMLKAYGARQLALNGRDEVTLEFYPSYRAMTRALEKNGASVPFAAMLLGCVALVAAELMAFAGLLSGQPALVALAAFNWALAGAVGFGFARWLGYGAWPTFLPFLGVLPLCWAMVRSVTLALLRGGVVWRSTFYPTAHVRAGVRLGLKFKRPDATDAR